MMWMCTCGRPATQGVVHRDEGPCYIEDKIPDGKTPVDVEFLLSAVLCGWQRNNDLPQESADEQLCNRKDLSEKQKEWLRAFCDLWDKQVESFNV